jgi:class 3 adenylate cyclase/CHASE2 domain-containing sensor protein
MQWKKIGIWSLGLLVLVSVFFTGIFSLDTGFALIIIPMWIFFLPVLLFKNTTFRIGVSLSIVLAFFSIFQPDYLKHLLNDFNGRIQDSFFHIRGPLKKSGQVVVVDFDQKSIETLAKWPLPRTEIAKLIRNAFSQDVRVIGFDMVFAEAGNYSLKNWGRRMQNVGVQLKLPGIEIENSGSLVSGEDWEYLVEGPVIKKALLDYWQKHFESVDEEFFIETDNLKEREDILVEKFLEFDKNIYDDYEQRILESLLAMNKTYQKNIYQPPENPMLLMLEVSGEFFALRSLFTDPLIFEEGAELIIDNDHELGKAFSEGPAVAGGLFILEENQGSRFLGKKESFRETEGMLVDVMLENVEENFPLLRIGRQQVLNVPWIQEFSNHQGMFNVIIDRTGGARSYTMLIKAPVYYETLEIKPAFADSQGEDLFNPDNYETKILSNDFVYFALALQMFRVANGYDVVELEGQSLKLSRDQGFSYGDKERYTADRFTEKVFPDLKPENYYIPLDLNADIRINYTGGGGPWKPGSEHDSEYFFDYISLSDILTHKIKPGSLKNKYAIVGSSDPTLSDLVITPYGPAFPGIEVHATMIENLINQDYLITKGPLEQYAVFIGILLLGSLISGLLAYSSVAWSVSVLVLALVALPVSSYLSFAYNQLIFDFFYAWICVFIIYSVGVVVNVVVEGKEKRFLKTTFKNYLSPELIDKMLEDKQMPNLGGEEGMLTAYFTDIAGFSTFSEALGSPTKLVELLNEYLSAMTDILLEHGGTLDKYEGDAIIAFFGAPAALENNPRSSCLAAIHMQYKLLELREKWVSEGEKWPELVHVMRMRIGVNYGKILTGNMGSEVRMNYTMMGDPVNLAARLESAAKQYGCYTFCSLITLEVAGDDFLYRKVDRLRVMGKTEPVIVCELFGLKKDVDASLVTLVSSFEEAWEFYENMEWDKAIEKFEKCLELEPFHKSKCPDCKTTPSEVFIERCQNNKKNPPVFEGEKWDGVFTATSK